MEKFERRFGEQHLSRSYPSWGILFPLAFSLALAFPLALAFCNNGDVRVAL